MGFRNVFSTNGATSALQGATNVLLAAGNALLTAGNAILTTINAAVVAIEAKTTNTLFNPDSDNVKTVLKASAGKLYKIHARNENAVDCFVQLWDLATGDVTVGTTAPKWSLLVPAGGGVLDDHAPPMGFATAMTYASTVEPAGSTDPTIGLVVEFTLI